MKKAKKMIKIILLMLIVAVVIIAMVLVYIRNNRETMIIDGPGMINTREGLIESVSYSYSGGMTNESTYYNLTRTEDGGSLLEYEFNLPSSPDLISGSVKLEYDAFTEIRRICRETECLLDVDKGKPYEFELLDGPTSSVTFILYGEGIYSFSSTYEYPEKCNNIIGLICIELEKLLPADLMPLTE